ncbi:MAG: hypothetical protein HY331_05310 [Chloroflexi bacterium]|nr:hypothetical protein [Chloroflexota bacterium]
MDVKLLTSLAATLVAFVFAGLVFGQYRARGRPNQLVWSVALAIFGVATGCQVLAEAGGWNSLIYRLWYLSGALLGVVYLGLGTVYLMAARRTANGVAAVVVVASLVAGGLVLTAPVDLAAALGSGSISGEGMPRYVRLLTPIFNTLGTLALVGGALRSAWLFRQKSLYPHRVVANVIIAVGALVVALGGTLARFGRPEFIYLTELVGIAILFIGFLKSTEQVGKEALPQQRPMGVQ